MSNEDQVLMMLLSQAYLRGIQWIKENPDSENFAVKASLDYADKTMGDLTAVAELLKSFREAKPSRSKA